MKILFTTALALSSIMLSAQEFKINGHIKGEAAKGKKVYLINYGQSSTPLDSTIIDRAGRFSFSGVSATPRLVSMIILTNPSAQIFREPTIPAFVEEGSVSVEGIYDSLLAEAKKLIAINGKFSSVAKIKGSKSHDLFMRFYEPSNKLDEVKSQLFDQYLKSKNSSKNQAKGTMETGVDLAKQIDEVERKRKEFTVNFILSNPASEVLAYIANKALGLSNINVDEIDQLTNKLKIAVNRGPITTELLENAVVARKTAVGSDLVDFVLYDAEGKGHKLSEYIGKGRYVLLEFWASWCGPCRADIPKIKEAFSLYHSKGFDIVGISLDENKEKWLKAVGDEKLNEWPQLIEQKAFKSDLTTTYRISSIPACLLFDSSGKLVTRNMRGSWMHSILIDLYGNLFDKKTAKAGEE